jgi:hypothetical protein
MLDVFLWLKGGNPNSIMWLNCWWCGVSRTLEKLFFGLYCWLLQGEFGELVSVIERNLGCLMKTLHELCESQLCEGIGREIFEERRDEE